MNSLKHLFSAIMDDLSELSLFKDKPAGHIRLTCGVYALESAPWPTLVDEYLKSGELVRVLEDWIAPFKGYYRLSKP
ncbi:hypothetical protein LDJ79_04090 [Vibrio tritonius]|uniref:Uncharacterized protein n=1 Tax=Vibrio tritonius TaxID=1435069 RepID=A0ABS7YHX4_9VIBR|nr:hypothetical protein [Vibrio tritonius]MCA2015278.1 hypothetical protein [Vibrio tritonius]